MSSTTRRPFRRPEEGQVLALFGGGIAALLIIATLAFDAGLMLVERRDEQNAADAAALAGARYVLTSESNAVAAARQIAQANGFDDADPNEVVNVYIPPIHGVYAGLPGFIEVQIESTRPSVFGGIIGKAAWPVGAFAVATNQQNLTFPFSMLALDETACKAIQVSGDGVIEAFENIQSNSSGADCAGDPVGFSRTGGSTINVYADDATCRAVGEIQDQGSGSMTCTSAQNSFALPDPLRDLDAPAKPALAPAMVFAGTGTPPANPKNCPGGSPAPSEATPQECKLAPNGSYKDLPWILYPGLYPAGLEVTAGTTAYLMPGIYWIGGGGIRVATGGSIFTIATETDAAPVVADATWGGGVLIYNSTLPAAAGGPIVLDGSAAIMKLKAFNVPSPDPDDIYNDMVIFQDRTLTESITLNGSSSGTEVEGLIYAPAGEVKLNGNGGTLIVDQIIASTFLIDGGGGSITVLRRTGVDAIIVAAGLVE
ncbi:MAG TPA: pilus assembly protein TadG-related protein [Candidatus Limnocylindrales bacterium]|nr:pilus assembly protein TadG-related protein [Candidatus Limnocylindrales bacterium]